MLKNFRAYGPDGVPCTATASSGATPQTIATTAADIMAEDAMIWNPGPETLYVKFSKGGVDAATTLSMVVPAGSAQPYAKGAGNDAICARTDSGTQAFVVWCGEGQ